MYCALAPRRGLEVKRLGRRGRGARRRRRFVPDLVVLDVGLPGLDGFEVCRRMRERGDVPILMLTARDEPRTASPVSTAAPTTTW